MQTADARRFAQMQAELHKERTARLKAERTAAGRKSAILRLQAKLAQKKADEAKARAEANGADQHDGG
jgi:hypothetical protein